jgi:hypothetical protein
VGCAFALSQRKRVASLNYPQIAEEALGQGPLPLRKMAPFAGYGARGEKGGKGLKL